MKSNNLVYFASIEDPHQLAQEITNKIKTYREWCIKCGFIALWQKKLVNYYGNSQGGNSSQAVMSGGAEGELSLIKVNDLHSLVQGQLVLVTGQRPAGMAKAINSDTKSQKASRIGTAISEFYMAQVGFEQKFVSVTECALLCDEGYTDLFWDKSAGDPIAVDPQTGVPEMSGDVILRIHAPWNVSRDPGLTIEQQKWNIISFKGNKFDFAAKYPRFAEEILTCKDDDITEIVMNDIPEDSDAIFAHLLVHDRTASVPNGRYSLMIGGVIVLDTDLPYKDYPIDRISGSDVIDGAMGYCSANDIMALEEVTDALHSIATTNAVTFGGQNLVGPQGGNIKITDIAKGLRYFELPMDMVGALRPLELLKTAPEVYNYIQLLGSKKEQAVGSNSVVRGNPEGQLAGASGSALALIQAQAISFNSGMQRSYFQLMSSVMTKLINVLAKYADTPKVATIVGKSKSAGLKQFKYTGEDLESISSIVYEMVNPISQTQGGRLTMAQDLIKANMVKSPKQYINVVATGQIDVLTEDDEADGLLILEENEWLMEGKPFKAIITQMHADHIKSHTSQITLDAQQNDPGFVARTLEHIQDHLNVWQQASLTNPGILIATGQQPLPPPPQPGLPPPAPPVPPGPQHLPQAPQHIGHEVGGGQHPAQTKAQEVRQPNLPVVAGTHERATVPGVTDRGI